MERAYPILRIDDYEVAKRYYVEFLGFEIEFEWRHVADSPVYMGVARGGVALHLSEHLGEPAGRPGAALFQVDNVLDFFEELKRKKSDMTEAPVDQAWGFTELRFMDPFENKLIFTSPTTQKARQLSGATKLVL